VLGSSPALAGETCYDFARQTLGKTFAVGDIVQADHLRVRIHSYERVVPVAGDQYVQVKSSANAGGSAPELYTYQANLLIEPRHPVSEIRLRVGESRGGPENNVGGHANIVVNGTRWMITGGLDSLNDKVIVTDGGARVRIQVKLAQAAEGSNWWRGTMKVQAKSADIASFGIGGIPVVVDDVCLTHAAP
jgi:hypothetical protein